VKLIIAGSRSLHPSVQEIHRSLVAHGIKNIFEIVSGKASGVDTCGEAYARLLGISLASFPADWDLGRGAGHIRNRQMAEYADALLLIWDGKSRGSLNMKQQKLWG
jgi:hypothetical protein